MFSAIRTFSRDLIDLAYPGRCAACGVAVDRGHRLCRDCDYAMSLLELRPQCLKCGAPVAHDQAPCQRCEGRGYRLFDSMVRMSVFESPFAELITRFKYYHGWSIGELLAERAVRLPRVRRLLDETDVLVPVPLHPTRHVARGFNQARVFADRVGALSGVKVASPVIRVQRTPQQALLQARQRIKNVRGAFVLICPRKIKDNRVTLVDDVFTSASTLKEVARIVRPAGPASVHVLTIAAADPKGHAFEAG